MITMKALALLLLFMPTLRAEEASPNWPQFRGPGFMGVVADNPDLPDTWSETQNVAWKTPVTGRGWSCPVVWGNRVFLTTSINSGETEPAKKGLYFGGNREKAETIHEWKVLCYDLITGKPLWDYQVHRGVPPQARHLKNSFASETPITDGKRVYAYIGNIGLFTFNLDGKLLWARSWDPIKTRYGWGTASSPFLHEGILYLINDNDEQSWLTALDAATGDTRWKIDRDEGSNWSTPFVWENSKRKELITTGTGKVRSYDLDGKLLWTLTGFSSITVPLPIAKDDLLYIGSGYVGDKKRPYMAVKPGASDDISLEDGETSNAFIAWSHPQIAPYMPTPILYRDRLYVLLDRGMLACYDPKTGEEIYKRKRLGRFGEFNSSPIAFNGKIFCLSERGATVVVKAGDEFEIDHVNELDEMIMATPAIVGDRLLIRTTEHLYCIRNEGLPVVDSTATASAAPSVVGEWALSSTLLTIWLALSHDILESPPESLTV
ncbi:MAG: outer membrane protein assembly factor BamB [Verrucomicrobiales bacterium]|jgi:outer membrane protein assembly factor BamB